MPLFRRLAALGAAAEAARRYAQKNPDKVRQYADKAARFADQRTHGKYRSQIEGAKRKVNDVALGGHAGRGYPPPAGGYPPPASDGYPPPAGDPTPRPYGDGGDRPSPGPRA